MRTRALAAALAATGWLIVFTAVSEARVPSPAYGLRVIPSVTGDPFDNNATALSDRGVVVGLVGPNSAFRWSAADGVMALPDEGFGAVARDVNDHGLIVGWVLDENGIPHAATWAADGSFTTLRPLAGTSSCTAFAVNERGIIAGSCDAGSANVPVEWLRDGSAVELRLPPGATGGQVEALNDHGVAVGLSFGSAFLTHATRWSQGRARDLGTLGGRDSNAADVNENGVIVGQARARGGRFFAVEWRRLRIHRLDRSRHESAATAINDRGVVVGQRVVRRSGAATGVLWRSGHLILLSRHTLRPAWSINAPEDINGRGQIVSAANRGDFIADVLLTPRR